MIGARRVQRLWRPQFVPTFPVEINRAHPLGAAVAGLYLPGSAYHGNADLAGVGPTLTRDQATIPYVTGAGAALASTVAAADLYGTIPAEWKFTTNWAMYWRGARIGSASGAVPLMQVQYDSANGAPYESYGLFDVFGSWKSAWNTGGVETVGNNIAVPTAGAVAGFAANFTVGGNVVVYKSGAQADSKAFGASVPSYSATSVLVFGSHTAYTSYSNAATNLGVIFSRVLTADEHAWMEAEPFGMLRPVLRRRLYAVGGDTGISVSLTGIAATASAGSVSYGLGASASGSGTTGSAGSVGPTLGMAASGSAATAAAGTATSAIGLAVTGAAMTVSAGALAYTIGFILTGAASTASGGTLAADNGAVTRSLTGIQMSAVPGNVRVTGGTRWVPQEARAVTLPTAVGNTLPPPPRLTGDAQADIRAQGQWLATLYDQMVKVNNVFGRINDHETRIAALEATNDNGN